MTLLSMQSHHLRRLIERYSGPCPRYTSYPTAVEFHDGVDRSSWTTLLEEDRLQSTSSSHSIYIHLPFCYLLCYFCACNKIITRDRGAVGPYLQALFREFELVQSIVGSDISLEQIHWGGGTPNYLLPAEMEQVHRETLSRFPNLTTGADVSIEIDPRTLVRDHLKMLRSLGFSRVSFGVQDFDPVVQEAVNRIQPFEMTRDVCDWSREEGFQGVNIDLIYGLPGQTMEGFSATLDRIGELMPDRIALYGYAHVTWLTKAQKALERVHVPTPPERVALFLEALARLQSLGYEHIGLDHFALPQDTLAVARRDGKLNRNFMGYTTHRGARILGFGVSAISSLPSGFAQNWKTTLDYTNAVVERGTFAIERGLIRSQEDQLRGEIIEQILCRDALRLSELPKFTGLDAQQMYSEQLAVLRQFEQDELIEIDTQGFTVTPVGRLFGRNIASTFDAYLAKHRTGERKTFSQAV